MPDDRKLHDFLQELLRRGGSDLLLVHGVAASIRTNGEVEKIGDGPLDGSEIESLVQPVLTPVAAGQYRAVQIADSSYRIPGLGRFRIKDVYKRQKSSCKRCAKNCNRQESSSVSMLAFENWSCLLYTSGTLPPAIPN